MPNQALQPWDAATDLAAISSGSPAQIVSYGSPQLSPRDIQSIRVAFDNGSYEMAATFIWTKAASVLKRHIASLGMEFVGEMLNRPDIRDDSDPATAISDREAISLAEDLGLVNQTQAFRLNQSLGLVTHFTRLEPSSTDAMEAEEAVMLLKTCIAGVLSRPNFDGAIHFADFRAKLSSTTLKSEECVALQNSPYFFLRTTVSVLMSLIKTEKGAAHEHALGNVGVILPLIWPKLREKEKWQIGQTYAELMAEGKRAASAGLKSTLLQVHGFDFVPESLRSNTFTEAAARVLAAHYGWNNFFTEEEPMVVLANLGTAIPKPAFAKCMEATLAVWLGNYYGHSWSAQGPAKNVFDLLRNEQWEYYINECLLGDKTVLDKLADNSPIARWISLVESYLKRPFAIKDQKVFRLLEATNRRDYEAIKSLAIQIRKDA